LVTVLVTTSKGLPSSRHPASKGRRTQCLQFRPSADGLRLYPQAAEDHKRQRIQP